MRVLPPIVDDGNLLMRWHAYINASVQKDFDNPEFDNMHRTLSSKVWFILSATSFYCGISLTMKCLSMPSSRHNYRNGSLVYLIRTVSTPFMLQVVN